MGGSEREQVVQNAVDDAVRAPGRDGPPKVTRKLDDDAAWPRVDAILKGNKKDLAELPHLVTFIDADHQNELWQARWSELSKLGGDVVLDVMRSLKQGPSTTVSMALKAAKKPTPERLRLYLRSLSSSALAEIDDFTGVRTLLTGKLLEELPVVARGFYDVSKNRSLVEWLAATTPKRLYATMFAEEGSKELADVLNELGLWDWIDHLPSARAHIRMNQLARHASDDAVRDKITNMMSPIVGEDYEAMQRHRVAKRAELDEAVADERPFDRAQLMELIGDASGTAGAIPFDRLAKLMRRAKLTPDDVVDTLKLLQADLSKGLPLLVQMPGVTKSQIVRYAAGATGLMAALRNDRTRKLVRDKLGTSVRLRDLFDSISSDEQKALLEDEALRGWYISTAGPEDLLALCADSVERAARACRIVKAQRGMDWVHQLSPSSNGAMLRVLATHCGDPKLATFIREVLISDAESSKPAQVGPVASNPSVYGGERVRLQDAVRARDDDSVLARLADMDDAQRAALARDRVALPAVLREAGREHRLRAVRLLDLSFGDTVAFAAPETGYERELAIHLRSRPAAEELQVLDVKDLVERALRHVHPDPLQTFPSLLEPKRLAKAIDISPLVVERLLAGSESSRALRMLGHQDVRKKFEAILEAQPELVDFMPRYQHLDAKAQKQLDKVSDEVRSGGEAEDALSEVQAGTYSGHENRKHEASLQARARDQGNVAEAIRMLANEGGDTNGAMSLVAQHHDAVVALLDDATQWPTIEKLARLVDLPPNFVFKVGTERLLMLRNARRWWMQVTPAFVLLEQLASVKGPAFASIVSAIDRDLPGTAEWLSRLPVGSALTDGEERTLDAIQVGISSDAPLASLFRTRFGIAPPRLEASGLKRLYSTLSRLPDAHTQQQRIKEIKHEDSDTPYGGYWSDGRGEVMIDEALKPGGGDTKLEPRSSAMTREQVRAAYGWDDTTIDRLVKEKRLEQKQVGNQTLFELPDVSLDKFTQVILHEVGHSVDSILGMRTEAVYGIAGWRSYDEGDFETWAKEMGGWDKVSAEDRPRIKQAWLDALKATSIVENMVDANHPARAKKYAGVGIVDALLHGKNGTYGDPINANGRTFVMQPYYGYFYSLNEQAAKTAPSTYALYAPAEYFAECYVEYYRFIEAAPQSKDAKGGLLPSPIKSWFDANVDNVRFDPKRLKEPTT